MKICLLLEGSYPYITGGVSAWVHDLIRGLDDIEFTLFTISAERGQTIRYDFPPNVVGHQNIVLTEHVESRRRLGRGRKDRDRVLAFLKSMDGSSWESLKDLAGNIGPGMIPYFEVLDTPEVWDHLVSGYRSNNPVYPFSDFFWAWKSSNDMINKILNTELPHADLYHSVSTGYAGLAGAVAKARSGRPFVLTEHGLYHKEREMEIRRVEYLKGYQRDLWNDMYRNLSRLAYEAADTIISLFEYNRRKQIETGAREDRCMVIPNGIDLERYAVRRKPRPGYNIGLVGRIVPIKDITTFITTCRIVADLLPEARFYCIGPEDEDPMYYEDCKRLVEMFRLEDVFTFTGRKDVREYYAFLDCMLLTSVREAQPLVILEAYLAGIPMVSTRVGNIPELLDYNEKLLADPKDAEQLAAGVLYLHDHPGEVETMREVNRQKTIRFYSLETVYDRYRDLYSSLAGSAVWQV